MDTRPLDTRPLDTRPVDIITQLEEQFPEIELVRQETKYGIPTAWLGREALLPVLRHLQRGRHRGRGLAPGRHRALWAVRPGWRNVRA